jgi:UDP-N-acetylmuramate dehydrogenase
MYDIKTMLLESEIPFKSDLPSKGLSFYRGGGCLSFAVFPKTVKHLSAISKIVNENGIPFSIVGAFTNLLVKDSGYKGLAIMTENLKSICFEGNILKAGAGEKLPQLSSKALGHSLSGLECFSGIPSSLGGAIYMNAGAYGEEIKSVVASVDVFDIINNTLVKYKNEVIPWDYRTSGGIFDNKIITFAELMLKPKDSEEIEAKMCLFRRMRVAAQPTCPSLGSVFKNPEGISAGYYIDRAGLKGYCMNGAAISEKHGNFIINTGEGTAEDYITLMELAKATVYRKFGIELMPEIKIIG